MTRDMIKDMTPQTLKPHKLATKLLAALATGLLLALLAAGCSGSSSPSRDKVLRDLAADTIIPAYEQLQMSATLLNISVLPLCPPIVPTPESIAGAQDQLADARRNWSYTEAMKVGPAATRSSRGYLDWPINPSDIENLIVGDIPGEPFALSKENIAQKVGADQRGLRAVEYMLGDPNDPSATAANLDNPNRCDYLRAVTGAIEDELNMILDHWETGAGEDPPFREAIGHSETMSLDALVNDALHLLEAITDMELGPAIGRTGTADPNAIAEGPAGLGLADMIAHLDGLRAVFIGDGQDKQGLSELLGDELTSRLASQLDAADAALAAIDGPLTTAATDNPAVVEAAFDAIKAVQVTVNTEVVSQLGVTIGFSDQDGDSAG